MTDLGGPANAPNSVTTMPADGRIFGSLDTYFQDCSSESAQDGTQIQAAFLNFWLNQLRNAIRGMGIAVNNSNLNMLLEAIQAATPIVPAAGQVYLAYASPTALTLSPRGGSCLTIDGVTRQLTGPITVSPTNLSISGIGGQSLSPGIYDVFAMWNGSAVVLDFWPTSSGLHMTDTTPGNVGVEVRNNSGVPDSSRTYVGKIYSGAGQFQQQGLGVLSWFNRRAIPLVGNIASGVCGTSGWTEINATGRVGLLSFGDEAVDCSLTGEGSVNTTGWSWQIGIGFDATNAPLNGAQAGNYSNIANSSSFAGLSARTKPAEGFHYITPVGITAGGTGTIQYAIVEATVRG